MNFTCRLCLCKSKDCVSLFENNGNEIVESLTSIKIQKSDNFPLGACTNCWQNIKLAYRIQQDILECDKKLRLINCLKSVENPKFLSLKNENHIQVHLNDASDVHDDKNTVKNLEIKTEQDFREANDEDSDFLDIISFTPFAAKCSICGEELRQGEMDEHVKKHFFQPQNCETCNIKFDTINSFEDHKIKEHALNAQQTFECDACGCCFKYESFYKIHIEKAHVSDKQRKIDENKSKRVTRKSSQKQNSEALKCDTCDAAFGNKLALKKHNVVAHGISEESDSTSSKSKECPICHLELRPRNYRLHMSNHAGPIVCHVCGSLLKNYRCLDRHIRKMHSAKHSAIKCEFCDKSFTSRQNCKSHINRHHNGTAEHVCDVCGKSFYRGFELTKHVRMTHMKLRPHVCEYCDKSFFSKFLLNAHLRQHTNDTPYRCDECGEAFKHNVSLKTHKRSKHNIEEEKKVCCSICGKGFASAMAVSCHMKKHNSI